MKKRKEKSSKLLLGKGRCVQFKGDWEKIKECIKKNETVGFSQSLPVVHASTIDEWNNCREDRVYVQNFIGDIIPVCTIYNRPNLIALFFQEQRRALKVVELWSNVDIRHLISLTNVLSGFSECHDVLCDIQRHLELSDKNIEDYTLFETVFEIGRRRSPDLVGIDILKECFQSICKTGKDINCLSSNGYTIMDAIILHGRSVPFEELFKIALICGADVNAHRPKSHQETVFSYLYLHSDSLYFCVKNRAQFLKMCMYENPWLGFDTEKSIIHHALWADHTEWEKSPYDEDKFLSYTFVTILHHCGISYNIHRLNDMNYLNHLKEWLIIRVPGLRSAHFREQYGGQSLIKKDKIAELTKKFLSPCGRIRSLMELCRLRLRRQYPGRSLHRTMRSVTMPARIRDYILMEEYNVLQLQI